MMRVREIGFVFTNYNNAAYTRQAVKSILDDDTHCRSHIVVVDNASEAADVSLLRELAAEHSGVRVIYNDSNEGYFAGLNRGLQTLRASAPLVDHVVVGNNDLVFPRGFHASVDDCAQLFERVPVVAPDLVTLDGVHQNPHVRFRVGFFRERIWDLYYSNYTIARLMLWAAGFFRRVSERRDHEAHDQAGPIEQGYGACYILGPLFFERFGLLWAPTFLMGEEYFLTKQLADKGFAVYYEPSIRVLHHDHATIGKVPSEKLWRYGREAHLLYRVCEKERWRHR